MPKVKGQRVHEFTIRTRFNKPVSASSAKKEVRGSLRGDVWHTENDCNADDFTVLKVSPHAVKARPPIPAIKPLRWKGPDSSGEYHSLDGLWGYIIRAGNGNGFWLTEVGRHFGTPEIAMQYAWADYQKRILSALAATEAGK